MKKITCAFAIVLALIMAALPCAMAAETEATVIQISDLKIKGGETPIDLTGLTLQAAVAGDTLFIDAIAGGETALSAMAYLDGESVVGYLGGMTNGYRVTFDALLEQLGVSAGAGSISPEEILTLIQNWELPGKLTGIFAEFIGGKMTYGEAETRAFEGSDRTIEFEYVPFTADASKTFDDIIAALKEDKIFGQYMESFDYEEGDAAIEISGGSGKTEDGSSVYEGKVRVETADVKLAFEVYALYDAASGVTDYCVSLKPEGEEGELTLKGTVEQLNGFGDTDVKGTILFNDGAGKIVNGDYSLKTRTPNGMGEGYERMEFALDIPEVITVEVTEFTAGEGMTPEYYCGVDTDINGQETSAFISFVGDSENSGEFIASLKSGAVYYEVSAKLAAAKKTIDTGNYRLDSAKIIDIFDMDEEASATATQEMGMVLMQAMMQLQQKVPGLSALTGDMFGGETH